MRRIIGLLILVALAGTPALAAPATIDGVAIEMQTVGAGFERPVALLPVPGKEQLLVVEKTGRVRLLTDGKPGAVFLDLAAEVSRGNEQGLLGLAFDPGFASNGRVYVDYTDKRGDTQIVSFTARDGVADPASAKTLLTIAQPQSNHNGGWIAFGPDGLLYIAMGDGGGGGDRHGETGNGQNRDVLLGKILRLDPNGGDPYAIPAGNPFAQGGGKPEIFLYGVRNPWRNAFDGELLYVADVGQGSVEEVNVLPFAAAAGANLGWRTMEGNDCYPPGSACDQAGLVMPVFTYTHEQGCSITGGLVYRGAALPALAGRYFFADYCNGVLQSFRYADGAAAAVSDTADTLGSLGQVTSFGTDAAGEMYVLTDDGSVLKMVAAGG
jgi:glucose/arabinose dehydrogenase